MSVKEPTNEQHSVLKADDAELEDLNQSLNLFEQSLMPEYVETDVDADQPLNDWLIKLRGDVNRVYKAGLTIAEGFDSLPLLPLYKKERKPIPAAMKVANEEQNYTFYKVEAAYSNKAEELVKLKNVEFTLEIKDDSPDESRETRFIEMFPENTYEEILKSKVMGKVGLNANGKVKVVMPTITLPYGHVEGDAGLYTKFDTEVDLVLDDFVIKKALIESTGLHHTKITWWFSEIVPRDDFKVWVFLKVPKEIKEVEMIAKIEAHLYKDEWWPLEDTYLKRITDKHARKINL